MKLLITQDTIDKIKKYGIPYKKKEVKGFLFGFVPSDDTVIIVEALPCPKYAIQNSFNAQCNSEAKAKLISLIPAGIEFVGEYHTHLGYNILPSGNDWESFKKIKIGCIYDTQHDKFGFFDGSKQKMLEYKIIKGGFSEVSKRYLVSFNGVEDIVYLPNIPKIDIEKLKVYNILNQLHLKRVGINSLYVRDGKIGVDPFVKINIHISSISFPLVAYLRKEDTFKEIKDRFPYEIGDGWVIFNNGFEIEKIPLKNAYKMEVKEGAEVILFTKDV